MKTLFILLAAAMGAQPAQEPQHDIAAEPAFMEVPPGQSMTCTAPGGCFVLNRPAVDAIDKALASCHKGKFSV